MWQLAGWSSDFTKEPVGLVIDGQPMVFWRLRNGDLAAVEDRCAHRHMPLSMGLCVDDHIECPYHGLKFAASGHCVEVPGQKEIPLPLTVRAYPVEERQGWTWVWSGQKQIRDAAVIPTFFDGDERGWVIGRRTYQFAAPADLVAENLLDTAHFGYVHGAPFRPDWWIDQRPVVSDCEGGIAIEWWARNLEPPGGSMMDQRSRSRFLLPAILEMQLDNYAPGTAAASVDHILPLPLGRNRAIIAAVPVSQATSRVLVQWSIPDEEGATQALDVILEGLDHGFAQDRRIVEAQYSNQVRFGMPPALAVRSDAALLRYQRLRARKS